MTLVEFLLARIAEDEEILSRVESFQHSTHGYDAPGTYSPFCPTCRQMVWGTKVRALAECESKRRIVELHAAMPLPKSAHRAGELVCSHDDHWFPCETLALLAPVYADHPDYDASWRA